MTRYTKLLIVCLSVALSACSPTKTDEKPPEQLMQHRPYRVGVNENPQPVLSGKTARPMRYQPADGGFSITNGTERFNRPLYIGHKGARLDAGDRPEFAFYLPGKGGVLRLGLISRDKVKWMLEADTVIMNYRNGRIIYEITDALLGDGRLEVEVVPAADMTGAIIQIRRKGGLTTNLIWAYGGATGEVDFRGDIGYTDIVKRYELLEKECQGTSFQINGDHFVMRKENTIVSGMLSQESTMHLADAAHWEDPAELLVSRNGTQPVVVGQVSLASEQPVHLMLVNGEVDHLTEVELAGLFEQSVEYKRAVAGLVAVDTPDPYVNALVPALNIAADALWDGDWYMHGNVAWRVALIGWRCPYTGDILGQGGRTRKHIRNSLATQITGASSGKLPQNRPVWGRNKEADEAVRAFFSEGRLNGTPHYDWNLVLIDVLMRHLLWTGDLEFAREAWPYLKRHMAWEKRLFDRGGLYDAMPAIWASDALQYNGGGAAHTTAYNYYHNKMAARIARLIDEDPHPYETESHRIYKAMQKELWLEDDGVFAEFRDLLGEQKAHPAVALSTFYHSIDSEVPDAFQAWQMSYYIETRIPHIPVHGPGVPEGKWSVVPSTTWMPYIWSINNVSPDEIYHTALACWQTGRSDLAWQLFMGSAIENMYRGICPGNVGMTVSFDAYRGENIRDFGDAIGVLGRSLVEGLFGVVPDMLADELTIRPGWPAEWEYASFRHPSVKYAFERKGREDHYRIVPQFGRHVRLRLIVHARGKGVDVFVDGRNVKARNVDDAIGKPSVVIETEVADSAEIVFRWKGESPSIPVFDPIVTTGEIVEVSTGKARITEIKDPQQVFKNVNTSKTGFTAWVASGKGYRSVFVKVKEGDWQWWMPVELDVRPSLEIVTGYDGRETPRDESGALRFRVRNNSAENIRSDGIIRVGNWQLTVSLDIPAMGESDELTVYPEKLLPGRHTVCIEIGDRTCEGIVANWGIQISDSGIKPVDLNDYFNDRVTEIFKEGKYIEPDRPLVTLGVPNSGFGEWCLPDMWADYRKQGAINDRGLRAKAMQEGGVFRLNCGVPFHIPTDTSGSNIAFVSQWDTFPQQMTVPLDGRARHAYLLMAGSTYHMQSRFENGEITVAYTDGTETRLSLRNPETWWPIDRDYFVDDYAFHLDAPRPPRILLKTGEEYFSETVEGKTASSQRIIGGAATVLDMPLDSNRELQSLTIRAIANEVIIGLMGVTLAE